MELYDILNMLSSKSKDNNSLSLYKILINKNSNNSKNPGYELHHILPKSLFPEFKNLTIHKYNGIYLSFKDHLESHRLLALITDDIKMKHAYFKMSKNDNTYDNNLYAQKCKKDYIEHMKNTIAVVDKDGNKLRVSKNDPQYISGEYVSRRKNKIYVIDKDGNKFFVDKKDPRYTSGELVGHTKGMISVRHSITGETCSISKNDPRYLSGELVGVAKGKFWYNNGYINKKFSLGDESNGFVRGRLRSNKPAKLHSEESKRKISLSKQGKAIHSAEQKAKWSKLRKGGKYGGDLNSGKHFYNNGIKNVLCYPDNVPPGFIKGALKRSKKV